MRKIIIDCDPGVDDALAIFLALASHAEVEVLGLTCVKGNVAARQTYLNARRILAAADRLDIPVFAGLDRPILAPRDLYASVHGQDGLSDLDLPYPPEVTATLSAVDFLRQQAALYPGQVTLCPIGPMTNVAVAMLVDPAFATNLHAIAFMGGAAYCPGNMNDFAEFNAIVDPHAAEIVLQSGVPLVMFGLDVTMQARILPDHLHALRHCSSACANIAARMLEGYTAGDLHLHDPCVIAWLIDPTLFSGLQSRVRIVTDQGPEFGRSIAVPDPQGNCLVMTAVNPDRLFALLLDRLSRLP